MVEVGSSGVLVAFEGIDGCGKSTQLTRLVERLHADPAGREVLRLREPGGTAFGEGVRDLLLHSGEMGATAETLLYMAARAELYETVVNPALKRNAIVLLDRSYYSTAAYQGAGLEIGVAWILQLARDVTGGCRPPDRVVLLDIDVDVASRRLASEGADRIEQRGRDYFQRVRDAYRAYAAEDSERFAVVDGTQAVDDVEVLVLEALSDVL